MLSKSKYPFLSRADRRHPERLNRASLTMPKAPSVLLQTLLIRNGYWPEDDLLSATVGAIEQIKSEQARAAVKPQEQPGFVQRAWGKVKRLFA